MYRCAQCGMAVIVLDGEIIRACHCNAAVVADATATMHGQGGVMKES